MEFHSNIYKSALDYANEKQYESIIHLLEDSIEN